MICGSCNHENRADARYCSECGQPLLVKCAACGNTNSPQGQYCDDCGTALGSRAAPQPDQRAYTPPHLAREILTSRSTLEGELKQVTVLFCDIANSTELAHRIGAEPMHELLNEFFELAASEVHEVQGTINQFLGDGFMALFGAPVAHEDHVRRALMAALAIREKLQAARNGSASGLGRVRLRMGIDTGSVVVGKIGDNLRMDYTAVGDTTNLAARLQALAEPDRICVGETAYAAAHGYFELTSLGKHSLKGINGAVVVYDLLRARSRAQGETPNESLGIGSVLVGRDRELALLEVDLEGLIHGDGGIAILTGEPGAGKSRLVAEIRHRSASDDILWLEGRSISFGRNLSYWPFIEVIKTCFDIKDDDAENESWHKLEKGLEGLFAQRTQEVLPYLATVLSLRLPSDHEARVKYLDSAGMRRQVFMCMRQMFEQLAQRQPVVLLLEDWHWADQSSVDLAEHLLSVTSSSRLMVFFATRPEPGANRMRVCEYAAVNPGTRFQEVVLSQLNETHSEEMLANLVDDIELPVGLREQILLKTEGNPFYLEEVIRSLVVDGILVPGPQNKGWRIAQHVDHIVIPGTIQALLLARIDRLDEEVKQVLKLASVIGRSFFKRVLRAISETEANLEGSLTSLEHTQLIRLGQELPEIEYMFKHALVQEAAYNSMLAESRRGVHRRIAQAIEELFEDRLDEFTSLLAHHYTYAEEWEKAQEYLFKAGDQAGQMAGDTEALEHFRQAETAYVKAFGDKLSPLQRASLARKIGAALHSTGHYEDALDQFKRALSQLGWQYPNSIWGKRRAILKYFAAHLWRATCKRLGKKAKPRLEIEVAHEISTICHAMAWIDYFLDKERMLLDCMLELHAGEQSEYSVAEARGLSSLGFAFMTFDVRRIARKYHTQSIPVAEQTANPSAIAFAWFAQGFLDVYDGRWDECQANLRKGAAEYLESGDIRRWGGAILMLSFSTNTRGDLPQTRELAAKLTRAGQDAADPQLTSWGFQVKGYADLALGPLDAAAENMRQGVALAEKMLAWDNFLFLSSLLGKCLTLQGKLGEALLILDSALHIMKGEKLNRPFDQVELLSGIATTKLAIAEQLEESLRKTAVREARIACRKFLRSARIQPLWLPEANRLCGVASWISGKQASAKTYWQESIKVADNSKFPIERARTLLEVGQRTGDTSLIEQASEVFRETGANVFQAFALHALAKINREKLEDVQSVTNNYTNAIIALEKINAHQELACARNELANIEMEADGQIVVEA